MAKRSSAATKKCGVCAFKNPAELSPAVIPNHAPPKKRKKLSWSGKCSSSTRTRLAFPVSCPHDLRRYAARGIIGEPVQSCVGQVAASLSRFNFSSAMRQFRNFLRPKRFFELGVLTDPRQSPDDFELNDGIGRQSTAASEAQCQYASASYDFGKKQK